jgi:hypothetical protein
VHSTAHEVAFANAHGLVLIPRTPKQQTTMGMCSTCRVHSASRVQPRNLVRRGPATRRTVLALSPWKFPVRGHLVILRLWVLHLQIHIVSHIFGVNSVTNSAKRLARGLGRSQPQTQRRRNRCTFSTLQKCPSTSIGKPLAVLRTADTRFAPNLAITCEFTFEEKS